ncbi:rhomboid family intramembrane serine protease [Candidatus Pacearchaeota archaeon]|nr:rhomboid family intramembrane serine protease [Candidatus Pacearchaeota archaeon]
MINYNLQKKGNFLSGLSLSTKIIIFNSIVYFVLLILYSVYSQDKVLNFLAITPSSFLSGSHPWTILTSVFVHASFFHIFANMFSLFFLGRFLEQIIGKKRFFWVYLVAGIVGSLFFVASGILFNNLNTPAVGASGAIFGLLGVLAVLVPMSRIYLIVGPLILIVVEVVLGSILPSGFVPIVSLVANLLMIVMIISLFSFSRSMKKIALPVELPMWCLPIIAIVPLTILSFIVPLPIGNSAHFGGLVIGLIYGLYLRKKFPNKTKRISNYFSGK